ncbi:Retrovirus-related Pol polyprotein from transposon TNT 1-94 [Vitis vinifera]|uniref:Retrovirus-related Pol polyprotein from transposon TNT 1-94 n=1 Tax=Vitis vinifera TaxID=29760 RepID=A0A438CQU9_VITVI|nr:Retrovirus-related Pol polyprotein from transposon TNT 1-94 [Vitis vinifera]RVW68717.1 Retrovirus-related Pol polyprotein from transposon TNT 1-94 [Vitis vinifera]
MKNGSWTQVAPIICVQEINGGKILLGNNMSCSVVGIGTVAINMFDGMTRTLKEVRHAPDLKRNLIYLRTLDESGYNFKVEIGKLTISKAVMTTCYLVNRTPSSAIDLKTLEELWSGKPSNYDHLRIFGCTTYVHQSEGKLVTRSIKCIFLGYPEGVKGYKLWNKESSGIKKDSKNKSLTLDKDHFKFEVELSSQDGHDQQNDLAHGGLETKGTKVIGSNVEGGVGTNSQEAGLDYLLSRDRAKRNIKPPDKFGFADLIAYALLTTMEYEESEPLSYQEAINNNEAMSEEFESL